MTRKKKKKEEKTYLQGHKQDQEQQACKGGGTDKVEEESHRHGDLQEAGPGDVQVRHHLHDLLRVDTHHVDNLAGGVLLFALGGQLEGLAVHCRHQSSSHVHGAEGVAKEKNKREREREREERRRGRDQEREGRRAST